MANLKVILKQHTPLIQFQGEQSGALLRGTEIKPKLDKFLIKHAFNDDFEKYKQFLIGYSGKNKKVELVCNKALNYKIRCKVIENNRAVSNASNKKNYPFYFNNMGAAQKTDNNKFVECDKVTIEFFSMYKEVLDKIKEWIRKFFLVNNFGFRQNKGYGSFTVSKIEEECFDDNDSIDLIKSLYNKEKNIFYLEYSEGKKDWLDKLKNCEEIYKIMKSGMNRPYYKSYLFQYQYNNMQNNGEYCISNEKRFIKDKLFKEAIEKEKKYDYKYIRALLGVAEGSRFMIDKAGKLYTKESNGRRSFVPIHYTSNDVERFASPIFFKIIERKVIIIPMDISEEIYGKKFKFTRVNKRKDYISEEIHTPSKGEFDLEDFLCKFCNYYNDKVSKGNKIIKC